MGKRNKRNVQPGTGKRKKPVHRMGSQKLSALSTKGRTKNTLQRRKNPTNVKKLPNLVTHLGGCHCGAVRFSVEAPADIDVLDCNCSICTKKQNNHFVVPKSQFTLLQGSDSITTYTFNTHKAKHTFCKICGVQSFYTPRSNLDGYGIMPHCLDPGTVKSTKVTTFDGIQWEKSIESSKIRERSKESVY